MAKITIEITENDDIITTYTNNDGITCNIFKANTKSFVINKVTDKSIIILISNLLHQVGLAFRHQLMKQGFINKPKYKPTDKK